jgi:hypothetical protein
VNKKKIKEKIETPEQNDINMLRNVNDMNMGDRAEDVWMDYNMHLSPYVKRKYQALDDRSNVVEHNRLHQLWLMVLSVVTCFLDSFPCSVAFYGEAMYSDWSLPSSSSLSLSTSTSSLGSFSSSRSFYSSPSFINSFKTFHMISTTLTSHMNRFFTISLNLLLPPLLRCTSIYQPKELSLLPLLETNIITSLLKSFSQISLSFYIEYKNVLKSRSECYVPGTDDPILSYLTQNLMYSVTFPFALTFRNKIVDYVYMQKRTAPTTAVANTGSTGVMKGLAGGSDAPKRMGGIGGTVGNEERWYVKAWI